MRPRKNNADYFSHDSGMRNDEKILSIRNKYNNNGYAVFCMLLEILTNKDEFKIELKSDIQWELLAGDLRVSESEIKDMISFCVRIDLLQENNGVFYSKNLIKRLQPVIDKREEMRCKYMKKVVSASENKVSASEMTQSKVKESKVKNIKNILSSNDDAKQQNNNSVKTRSEAQQVVDYWIEKWEKTFNTKRLSVRWDIYVKNTNPIVKQLGVDRMKKLLDLWFIDNEWGKKCKWEYGAFIEGSNINKLNTQL